MQRKLLFHFILITTGLWALPLHAQLGLALVPMRAEIQITPGSQHTESVHLSNDSPAPVRVRAEALDFYIDENLTPQFGGDYKQEQRFSCRTWLQINPREFDLESKTSNRVRYTVQVPNGTAEGEYHCGAGFVSMAPITSDQTPMGMRMAVRAVTSIYVIIGKPPSSPALKDLSLRNPAQGIWQAAALYENTGRRLFRVKGVIEVRDEKGQLIESLEYPPFPVLPEREQLFPLPLKEPLSPGTYILHTKADVGLPAILEATTRVVVDETLRAQQ